MRAASKVTFQTHQVLRLPRNSEFKISARNPWIASAAKKSRFDDIPSMIRARSKHDLTMTSSSRTRRFGDLARPILETLLYWKIQHVALRLSPKMSPNAAPATKVTFQLHQILCLPRKMNGMRDPLHIWNIISNARSNKSHPPTSPNAVPARQNESHEWSADIWTIISNARSK